MRSIRNVGWMGIALCVAMCAGCAADLAPPEAQSDLESDLRADDVGSTHEALVAAPQPAASVREMMRRRHLTEEQLAHVYELHHFVPVGRGRRVHVTEHFTIRSWLSWPHRGAVLLPGTVVTGSFYNLDVDGYRFAEDLAREGFFAFAIDSEGSGESTYPEDGLDVTHDYLVRSARRVLPYLRLVRLIRRLDVIGESNGGAIAAELCADSRRVRSCVLSSMLYEAPTPFLEAVFLDPGFIAFLQSQPNGYLDAGPDFYFNIAARVSPEVSAAILSTQPGLYAVPPLTEPTTLPWFDPTRARVPALIIQGTEDNIALQEDSELLAAAYGSARANPPPTEIVRIEGAGHIPRIEPGPNAVWSDAVLEFLTR